jgi:hypothetical protein
MGVLDQAEAPKDFDLWGLVFVEGGFWGTVRPLLVG